MELSDTGISVPNFPMMLQKIVLALERGGRSSIISPLLRRGIEKRKGMIFKPTDIQHEYKSQRQGQQHGNCAKRKFFTPCASEFLKGNEQGENELEKDAWDQKICDQNC